jgi:hypothetical protein
MCCVFVASKPALKWDADDSNDLFGHHSGKFPAERGLFDDLDDSTVSLWGSKDKVTADKGTCNILLDGEWRNIYFFLRI